MFVLCPKGMAAWLQWPIFSYQIQRFQPSLLLFSGPDPSYVYAVWSRRALQYLRTCHGLPRSSDPRSCDPNVMCMG